VRPGRRLGPRRWARCVRRRFALRQ
jgi:hypothetical protein